MCECVCVGCGHDLAVCVCVWYKQLGFHMYFICSLFFVRFRFFRFTFKAYLGGRSQLSMNNGIINNCKYVCFSISLCCYIYFLFLWLFFWFFVFLLRLWNAKSVVNCKFSRRIAFIYSWLWLRFCFCFCFRTSAVCT